MRTPIISSLLALVFGLTAATSALAAGQSNADYRIDRDLIDSGGGRSASSAYTSTGSLGQPVLVGRMDNSLHINFSGSGAAARQYYTLTVNVDAGAGTGHVISEDGGIDCKPDCTADYPSGTSVTLTAIADRDSVFVCYKLDDPASDCVSSLPNITRDITVYAIFDQCPWPADLTYLSPANGSSAQALNSELSWQESSTATSYSVYFGSSSPPSKLESQWTDTSFDPGVLMSETTYVWRIDAQNSCGTVEGPEWSFTTMPDEVPPLVTLSLDQSEIFLGQSVTIYTTATDIAGITEFHLQADADGDDIATAPGTHEYTPSAVGSIDLMASATDPSGNTGSATKTLVVKDPPPASSASMKFYEGLNPVTGAIGHYPNLMIFTPEMRGNITEISVPEGIEERIKFPSGTAWYFTFKASSVVCVPYSRQQAVLFSGQSFESISSENVSAASFETWPTGQAIGANDTVVVRIPSVSGEFIYFKLGNVQKELSDMAVNFSYQQIFMP